MGYQGCSVAVGCHHGSTAIWIFGCRRHLSSFCLSICLSKADDQLTVSERVWNSKVLREGVRGTSLFLKVPCSAPVLPSTSLWCFHLYTDVAPLQHPCEVSFSPAMWCQIICGEQRKKKKKKCRIFVTWGQKCTLRPKMVTQEDGVTRCNGRCSESLSDVALRDHENMWGKSRDHICQGRWETL